ncbi:hypothetical protein NBRC110019_19630 [Neptunitalea chrysea]|uniref:Holin-X, holin superfamily III n=1 Tax=Neptunitalea chrysea TaxID=1647581 RepID=A0A9W6B5B6_9FLAO|nr:hypothetical protein [Neptunitalea chrysea]GLB52923.1 hypothetical protein NBRC110019_19630 [Neptunitalea chrysea]
MFDDIKDNVNGVNENTQKYVKASISYYKLKVFKLLTLSITSLSKILITGFILVIGIIFISFAISIGIGDLLDNLALGFLIVGVFYIVVAFIFLYNNKFMERKILEKFSTSFFDELNDKD